MTGSLCYARLPEDMSNPLGVVYLFNSRLSGAKDSAAGVLAKFPNVDANSGFSLVTPHRTYQLFAESESEANAWKALETKTAALGRVVNVFGRVKGKSGVW